MAIRVVCEHCGSAMKIKDELAGRKGNCPKCKAEFQIPGAQSAREEAGGSSEYTLSLPPSAVATGPAGADLNSLPDFPGGDDDSEHDEPAIKKSRGTRPSAASRERRPPPAPTDFDPDDPFANLDDEDESPRPGKRKPPTPTPIDDFPDDSFEDEVVQPAARARKPARRPEPKDEEEEWDAFEEETSDSSKGKRSLPGAKGSAATVADDFMRTFSGSGADDLGEEEAPKKKRRIFGGEDKGLSEGNFELSDMLMYGATRALPMILGLIVVAWLVYLGSSKMMNGKGSLPPLGIVTGKVTLNGAPLPGATLLFQPVVDQDAPAGLGASAAITDDTGAYRLQYAADSEGAAIGKHRIEIRARNAQSQEIVPRWYNMKTMLRRDVDKGSNVIDFELDSRNPPAGWKP